MHGAPFALANAVAHDPANLWSSTDILQELRTALTPIMGSGS